MLSTSEVISIFVETIFVDLSYPNKLYIVGESESFKISGKYFDFVIL